MEEAPYYCTILDYLLFFGTFVIIHKTICLKQLAFSDHCCLVMLVDHRRDHYSRVRQRVLGLTRKPGPGPIWEHNQNCGAFNQSLSTHKKTVHAVLSTTLGMSNYLPNGPF